MIYPFGESPLSAEHYLVLKQGDKAIAKVASRPFASSRPDRGAVVFIGISRRIGILEDLGVSVQGDNQVRDPQRLYHLYYDRATDDVTWRVLAVGIIGLDVEFGEVARLGRQRRFES